MFLYRARTVSCRRYYRFGVESLTSNPCGWPHDNINMSFICMFVSPLCLDGAINRTRHLVSRKAVCGRPISFWEGRQRGFWHCRCRHDGQKLMAGLYGRLGFCVIFLRLFPCKVFGVVKLLPDWKVHGFWQGAAADRQRLPRCAFQHCSKETTCRDM